MANLSTSTTLPLPLVPFWIVAIYYERSTANLAQRSCIVLPKLLLAPNIKYCSTKLPEYNILKLYFLDFSQWLHIRIRKTSQGWVQRGIPFCHQYSWVCVLTRCWTTTIPVITNTETMVKNPNSRRMHTTPSELLSDRRNSHVCI